MPKWYTETITTDSGGDATASIGPVNGPIYTIIFDDTDLDAGLDIVFSTADSNQSVLTLTNQSGDGTFSPRQATHSSSGTALTYDGTRPVNDFFYAANEMIDIEVSEGGDTKTGSITIIAG